MSIGDIAALIAAIACAVLALAAAVPLLKLGRTVDELSNSTHLTAINTFLKGPRV